MVCGVFGQAPKLSLDHSPTQGARLTSVQPTPQKPLAQNFPGDFFFSRLALAKVVDEKSTEVAVRIPAWLQRIDYETREITEMISETKTRTVKRNGQNVTEEYTVQIPVAKTVTEAYLRHAPLPPVNANLEISDIKAWTTAAKPLSKDELKKRLAKATYLYALLEAPKEDEPVIDPFFAAALNENMLIVYSDTLNDRMSEALINQNDDAPDGVPSP
jgi:hypothetical protein